MADNTDLNTLLFQFTDLLAERLADKVMARINSDGSCAYNDEDILKTPEAAKILGVSPGTLRNWREKGVNLPYIFNKESGHFYYGYKDLMHYKSYNKRILPDH